MDPGGIAWLAGCIAEPVPLRARSRKLLQIKEMDSSGRPRRGVRVSFLSRPADRSVPELKPSRLEAVLSQHAFRSLETCHDEDHLPVESKSAPPSPQVTPGRWSWGTQTVTSPVQVPPFPSVAVKPRR